MTEQTAAPADTAVPVTGPIPPAPQDPPALPAQDPAPAAPRPPRRVLWAVLRWTAAVLVMGGLGAGTVAGITSMKRTDVPGLATKDDGRWDYPALTLPALPADAPRPYSDSNIAEIHHADLRRLLLPAPAGATVDKELDGGWTDIARYASEYGKDDRADLTQHLKDSALRHIAARGWTMPDGTSSRVYLLQFNSVAYSTGFHDELYEDDSFPLPLDRTAGPVADPGWSSSDGTEATTVRVYTESETGAQEVRHAYVLAGDTVALLVQTRKDAAGAKAVPFHQAVVLQNQLLG
ncbi:hypothetical protein ACFRH6_15955 [Streptomyces sp. NPDC056749]|uniref:hypothetical protein n=1 Tax=Streptomyces sp. NPDC056749 TaxID=3345936 RepID=UPI0036B6C03B